MTEQGRIIWREELQNLWKDTYGDQEEEIAHFFDTLFSPKLTWCYVIEGHPVSVIYGIPCTIWQEENESGIHALYLYAGATKKEYRGRGYYKNILCGAQKEKPELILMPVRNLIPYYQELGYELLLDEADYVYKQEELGESEDTPPFKDTIKSLTPSRYKEIRASHFGGPGFVEWGEVYLEFAIKSVKAALGIASEAVIQGETHMLLAKPAGETLMILETTLSRTQIRQYGKSMLKNMGCTKLCCKGALLMGMNQSIQSVSHFKIPLDE